MYTHTHKTPPVVYNANQLMKCENKQSIGLFDLDNGSQHKYKKIHDPSNLQWALVWTQFAKR